MYTVIVCVKFGKRKILVSSYQYQNVKAAIVGRIEAMERHKRLGGKFVVSAPKCLS